MDNSRSAHASPLDALLRGVPGGHVRLAVGEKRVVIAQLNRDHGHPHSLQLPAGPAVALVLDDATAGTVSAPGSDGAPSQAGNGTTLVANLIRPATLPLTGRIRLTVVWMPLESFDAISSSWRLKALPVPPGPVEVPYDEVAAHLCRALFNRRATDAPETAFINSMTGAFQAHFLYAYCRASGHHERGPAVLEPWQLRMAEDAMLSHLDRRTSIADIAEICGVSAVHFSRAFRRATDQTPHRWLMGRRLETARHLLESTDSTVAEIALVCGFADQSHLTRTFSSAYGNTPAAWRARIDASTTAT
jgi:AraC-like DNA-binding protein